MGFYSVCPGTNEYVMGSPVFEKTTIHLENGKTFVIHAKGNSKNNVYIQSAKLNNNNYTRNYITYQDLVSGGTLNLEMSATPNTSRGIQEDDRPFSLSSNSKDHYLKNQPVLY